MVTITLIQAKGIVSWLRRVSPKGDDDRRALVAMVELLEAKAAGVKVEVFEGPVGIAHPYAHITYSGEAHG